MEVEKSDPACTTAPVDAPESWQRELLEAYGSVDELAEAGLLTEPERRRLLAIGQAYRVRLPRSYAALIDNAAATRAACPIRLQALPALGENDPVLPAWAAAWSRRAYEREEPWSADAIGDLAKMAAPRLTHRYENRAILHLSSACAMYCRFCFRKSHLNDAERKLYAGDLAPALAYLAGHSEVRELVLTGGDPLSLSDLALERLFATLREVRHLRHIRIHSRMAATLPSRLTERLAAIVSKDGPALTSLVSHFNHPRELTAPALAGLRRLRKAGVPLYNQSVLLKGVNDDVETLATLFQTLYECGVRPFYLHHPDWTPGTFHFRTSIERGLALHRSLRGRLSGPALPDYVLDLPGGLGKIPLSGESWLTVLETHTQAGNEGLSGALYEVRRPATRAVPGEDAPRGVLYPDFWKA